MSGRLYVCATPIGNLADVTLRVLEVLGTADTVLAEDTRVTSRLLARYGIEARLERYDEHTAARRTPVIVGRIAGGETFALCSDAGTPGISDPGERIVDAVIEAGLPVEVLPGPSAITTALVASGLPTHAFYFGGFLPRKAGERTRLLESLATLDATLVFYESPRRTAATLATLAAALPGRRIAVARELTKLHEEVVRGKGEDLAREFAGRELKGEVVLVVEGASGAAAPGPLDRDAVRADVAGLVESGLTRADAVRTVAVRRGLPRRTVYEIAHE
jgi:16S rRNA (cytidine1402-2'-O)-methyltransferase